MCDMHTRFHMGSALVGLAWGLLVGVTPFFQPLDFAARWTLGLGLGLSYASIGLLVAVVPSFSGRQDRRWLLGAIVGLLYSVPGAVFTMVPYPLRDDAPRYWHEFAAGGWRAFVLTLGFGVVVGATCGLARRRGPGKEVT